MKALLLLAALAIQLSAFSQKTIRYFAADSIEITADYYKSAVKSKSCLILLHQEGSSRGEMKAIAQRLSKQGFHCYCPDLRSGKQFDYTQNETAQKAQQKLGTVAMYDAISDIYASLDYVQNTHDSAQIVILASGFSCGLAMKASASRPNVQALAAYSPGEYFGEKFSLKKFIPEYTKTLYVACNLMEYKYVKDLVSSADATRIALFTPEHGAGEHGAKSLSWDSPTKNEYWLSLLLFLRNYTPR